jgi:hypothetical protein
MVGSMTPGKYDFKLYRGDSYAWQFKLWQDSARTIPVVLTTAGTIVACEVRDKPGGVKIVPLDCVVASPNIINVTMTSAMCKSCPAKGGWDLQVTFPDGQVLTPVAGRVAISPDYTESS